MNYEIKYIKELGYALYFDGKRIEIFEKKSVAEDFAKTTIMLAKIGELEV